MSSKTIIIFFVACFGSCHSFKQVKRRFGAPGSVIRHCVGPRTKRYFTTRGGAISDGDNEDIFSKFIESFESELSEIRREAEIEAEIEMQKLLGLVHRSEEIDDRRDVETDIADHQITIDEEIEVCKDGEELTADSEEVSVVDAVNEKIVNVEDSIGERDNEIELSRIESVTPALLQDEDEKIAENVAISLSAEEDTIDLDDVKGQVTVSEDLRQETVNEAATNAELTQSPHLPDENESVPEVDEAIPHTNSEEIYEDTDSATGAGNTELKQLDDADMSGDGQINSGLEALDEKVPLACNDEDSAAAAAESEPIHIDDDISDENEKIATMPEIKTKSRKTSKSKKISAPKTRKQRKVRGCRSSVEDEIKYDDGYEMSSISITEEERGAEPTTKGLRYYLQTDLVRAAFLFIATIVVHIWLQRLQRQMEEHGI